jgi:hypothetical protein
MVDDRDPAAHWAMGRALWLRGDQDQSARAMGLARLGQYDEAAEWAIKAAARPNAHQHIMAIAAMILGLAGRIEEANTYKAKIRERVPHYSMADFLAAFRYSPEAAAMFSAGARKIGMS